MNSQVEEVSRAKYAAVSFHSSSSGHPPSKSRCSQARGHENLFGGSRRVHSYSYTLDQGTVLLYWGRLTSLSFSTEHEALGGVHMEQ